MEPAVRTKILIQEVMNSPVVTASPNDTVQAVAERMIEYGVGSIVIAEGDVPLGMVTERDIVAKAVAKGVEPTSIKAKQIMSQPIHMIDSDRDVTEAARKMRRLGIKRLGVSRQDRLVGIVSVSDLIAVTPELVELVSEKARMITGEAGKRRPYLTGYCDLCNEWSDYLAESDGKFLCEECRTEARRGD